jgi:hypothetical protein
MSGTSRNKKLMKRRKHESMDDSRKTVKIEEKVNISKERNKKGNSSVAYFPEN